MAVHILQVLCPSRHCLFALAYEEESETDESARARAEDVFATKVVNPWCGICGSRQITFEIGKTRFKTLQEAGPHLAEQEAAQLATRKFLEKEQN